VFAVGLDNIISYTITVDMESGQCDINYPMDTDLTELEMIRNLCEIVATCYHDLRNEMM
jgi:hypothetical protein